MASVGHLAVGMAAARWLPGPQLLRRMILYSALALAPDADVIGLALGVPYESQFGHRGASHSIAVALMIGVLAYLLRRDQASARKTALVVGLVAVSHGLLDALTDGGLGVALLWPFSAQRFFAPLQPIPVAPIGLEFFTARGLKGAAIEVLELFPLFAYALWPRRGASLGAARSGG